MHFRMYLLFFMTGHWKSITRPEKRLIGGAWNHFLGADQKNGSPD